MIACYDLSTRLTTYDFFNWLVHVKLLGATEIVFDVRNIRSRKWPVEESLRRFHNYIEPAPKLLDLQSRIGTDGDRLIGSHQMYHLAEDLERLGKPMPRLRSVHTPREFEYTVTLRDTFHNTYKNSDRELWLEFADRIGALVIDDYRRVKIGLYERLAYYAGARANFGVPNGPVSLIWWTPYPLTMFCDPITTKKGFGGHKISPGEQVPWLLPNQRMIWEKPTMEGLMRAFKRL